jgi:hypothetical protein
MTVSMNRVLVALNLPSNPAALIMKTRAILAAMAKSPHFPSPVPSLAKVQAALAALDAAVNVAASKTRGTTAAMHDRRAALVALLHRLKAYVQGVADDDPEHAASIIESAGMNVKGKTSTPKPPFRVKQGRVSGSVELAALAAAKVAQYAWQWSDDDGKTWHDVEKTMQARTRIGGLVPGKTYLFRFRALTRRGQLDWSEPASLVVR